VDFKAFLGNCARARTRCPSVADSLKYLLWLYNRTPRLLLNRPLRIHFNFEHPIGNLHLSVRCNHGSDAFVFSEVFEHRYYDLPLPMAPGTILDLGANIGLAALFFSRVFPKAEIACVEPMPENVAAMRANFLQNGVSPTVFAKAISIDDGSVTMQRAAHDYGHKINGIPFGKMLNGKTVQVPGICVPTLLKQLVWERIGLLKLDVEGYEGVLLRQNTEWLDRVDSICVECHEGFGGRELAEVAAKHGFQHPHQLRGIYLLSRPQLKGRN
jgi:FkbM family methyltransferase